MKCPLKQLIVSLGIIGTIASCARAEAAQPPNTDNPIVFTLYTVHRGVMKMTVQLRSEETGDADKVRLEVQREGNWIRIGETDVVNPGATALFRAESWDATQNVPFRVRYQDASWSGLIRKDPLDKREIVVAAFTGNSPRPGGGNLPKQDVVDNVEKIDPDLLVFTGDQVYNHNQHTMAWIQFGDTFGQLMRTRPVVCIPDDHDVGHGNLWGANGRKTSRDTDGGYFKPPGYVNMVQRAQTGHLPDPFDPTPVEQGITVYYTSLNVGGIDFAILEDRKFKSGCRGLVTKQMGPRADHVAVPDYDPKALDAPGRKLLGDRQLAFLHQWGQDWRGTTMKVVISQTVFSMVQNYHSRNKTFYYADLDSNGWPQTARNKALREMRRCFAFHICGDQHLASITHYGIDEWDDAGYAFCVPSIANLWPRWWLPKTPGKDRRPGAPDYTGKFLDGFGNKMTVHAVSNPSKTGREPAELHDKAPGFGIIRFDKQLRQITMECWPRHTDPTIPSVGQGVAPPNGRANAKMQYPGWPRTIGQQDNYGRRAVAYLPTLEVTGMEDPVVQVLDEAGKEIVYTLRIQGTTFRPKVFRSGKYTIKVGEPGTRLKVYRGVPAAPPDEVRKLTVDFGT